VSRDLNKAVSPNVLTDPQDDEQGAASVTISFAHTGCNPSKNEKMGPDVLQTLHLWYAMALFREGVAEIVKA